MDEAMQHARDAKSHYAAFRQAAANAIERASAEPTANGPSTSTVAGPDEVRGQRGAP